MPDFYAQMRGATFVGPSREETEMLFARSYFQPQYKQYHEHALAQRRQAHLAKLALQACIMRYTQKKEKG